MGIQQNIHFILFCLFDTITLRIALGLKNIIARQKRPETELKFAFTFSKYCVIYYYGIYKICNYLSKFIRIFNKKLHF